MKAYNSTDPPQVTKEEAISAMRQLAEELGRPPKKNELPPRIGNRIRPLFEKWCYALEEAGLRTPSEKVLEKRRKRDEHRKAVAARKKKREAKAAVRGKAAAKTNAGGQASAAAKASAVEQASAASGTTAGEQAKE